jgi:3-oxoacyl-[acyl-carrier-protein] synthase II
VPVTVAAFAQMTALSTHHNDRPQEASRPFDTGRDGFVIGEGAGALILEEREAAIRRGAKIYGELVGFGQSADAHHLTLPADDGGGAALAMRRALKTAGIGPDAIGYVNAHGTSTPQGDIAETKAIRKAFGEFADRLQVSSTKSMIGHLIGAAGAVEGVASVLALHDGILPPTINLVDQDPQCDLDYIPNEARKTEVEYALSNGFGFGGHNAAVVFRRHSDN